MIPDCLSQEKLEVEGIMLSLFSQERVTRQYGNEMKAEGKTEGKSEGRIEILLSLLKQGIITEETAARETGMSVDAFRKAVAALA